MEAAKNVTFWKDLDDNYCLNQAPEFIIGLFLEVVLSSVRVGFRGYERPFLFSYGICLTLATGACL